MRKLELLAPAKNFECVRKVIEHGADSIYMGYSKHNARMFGKNFSIKEFKDAVVYAHNHGVKVYLTLNTLIKEYEIKEAVELAVQAVGDGVDGILIQDLGLALEIRRKISRAIFHASTQMSIANHYGVKILGSLGFSRVVLAREISSQEIIQIKKIADLQYKNEVEIESFIHGGLCIAYSGQCFASSYLYGLSANRGMCKMPCWEKYVFLVDDDVWDNGTTIRPRDLKGLDKLKELIEGGIDCLKIQGRLRRENYISEIVDVYRKCIDTCGDTTAEKGHFDDYEKRLLEVSPRGLTEGNLSGKVVEDMIIKDTSNIETIEDVSGERRTYEKNLNRENIKISEMPCSKKISILLHKLNKNCSYSELTNDISRVYIPYREFTRKDVNKMVTEICDIFDVFLYMPPMIYEKNCEKCYATIGEILNQYRLKGIVLSNISDFVLAEKYKDKIVEFISGNHLHVMNSSAVKALENMGVINATLSLEISPNDASLVVENSDIPLEQIVYGHPELMHLKYCLYSKQNECGDCDACFAEKKYLLKNNKNTFEILLFPEQTESILYSTKILSISPDEWVGDSVRMDFLWETPQEINEIVSLMKAGRYYSGKGYLKKITID